MSDVDLDAFDAVETEAVRRENRVRFDDLLDEYRAGDGFEVPVAVKLAAGRKP